MKVKAILLLFVLCFIPKVGAQSYNNEAILDELDKVIEQKEYYHRQVAQQTDSLRDAMNQCADLQQSFDYCQLLFNQFLRQQADSAKVYVQRMYSIAELLGKPDLLQEAKINKAAVYGVMGLYNEAEHVMEGLDHSEFTPNTQYLYYQTMRTYLGWLADYCNDNAVRRLYMHKTNLYRDSILSLNVNTKYSKVIWAERCIVNGLELENAIDTLNVIRNQHPTGKEQAYIDYTISDIYEALDDEQKQIYYLAQTAIGDIKSGVCEYASLPKLAKIMYQKGQIRRAYSYLHCAMADASACKARLRYIEVTNIFPIVDNAYQMERTAGYQTIRYFLLGISLLAIVLIAALLWLFYSRRKLEVLRQELSNANDDMKRVNKELTEVNAQMKEVNAQLAETGRIKEVYIGKYLDRCVVYLDKLDVYRNSLVKLAMASRTEELFKTIKSEHFIQEERKQFYKEFDKSFLELFPHFIEDFNNLLEPEARILPKNNELLTTDLRIFALIRLGVTDTASIAHFLSCSLATIYNYRSKIRNKSLIKDEKDGFEQRVMQL